jgi:hypothetical protein
VVKYLLKRTETSGRLSKLFQVDDRALTCLHHVCLDAGAGARGTLDYDVEDSGAEDADEALDEEKERSLLIEDQEFVGEPSFVATRDSPQVAQVHKETHVVFSFGRKESELDRLDGGTDSLDQHDDNQDEDIEPSNMHIHTLRVLLNIGGERLCMQQDKQGQTALHLCCRAGHVNRSTMLFQCAGHELLSVKDNEGLTCIEVAELELQRLDADRTEAKERARAGEYVLQTNRRSEIELKMHRIAAIVRFLSNQGA